MKENLKTRKDSLKQMSDFLIDNGIDYNGKDKTAMTPIQYIVNVDVEKSLEQHALETRNIAEIWKYIYACAIYGTKPSQAFYGLVHLTVAQCFIQGMGIFSKPKVDQMEEIITDFKLNINETDGNGMTALHHLCYYEYDSEPYGLREVLVAKLLELGADPNIKDIRGYTPIMCAIEKGYAIKYDPLDPRGENKKGIGRLLKPNVEIPFMDLKTQPVEMQTMFTQHMEFQEAAFKQEIRRIADKFTEEITSLKSVKDSLEIEIISLKASKDALENKYIILQEHLSQQNQDTEKLKSIVETLQTTNTEIRQKLKDKCEEITKLKSTTEDLNKVNSELRQKQDDGTKVIEDLKTEITALQVLQNTHNEMQHKIEEQMKDINDLKLKVEEMKEDATKLSLLLGNVTLTNVCCHLETDVEVTCLPDASLEDLQAAICKDAQKYKNIYLVTGGPCDGNDVQDLIAQYRGIINAAKNKSKELIVSSILPTLEDKEVNAKIELVNKSLSVLCLETGCEFVDNDTTFKYRDGIVIEACFDEEGENLSEFGIKRLLKNLRLFTAKKLQLATNI